MKNTSYPHSWGRYPDVQPEQVVSVFWRNELPNFAEFDQPVLPYAYGRSYGDSCLNANGVSIDVSHLNRFLSFDDESGLLRCEAGVSLDEILSVFVPRGWFLPVSPGTKFVSVGGAIANDVHGKNHHKAGTFGCHVTQFELLRSNGERVICSPEENSGLFRATIGGLGLTGVILWAEFRMKRINNPYIVMDRIRYSSLADFMQIADDSDQDYEYTVAWVDCLASGSQLGRGVYMRGNNAPPLRLAGKKQSNKKLPLIVPFDFPGFALNPLTVKAFNGVYYRIQTDVREKIVPYEPFFYPLDSIREWNRIYGKRGFFQYQCVVPFDNGFEVMKEILGRISSAKQGSFLVVLKKFGDIASPGLLSFPRPGLTLALDFSNNGARTLKLFNELDVLVRESGGVIYPAKDARMSAEDFRHYYPQWKEFSEYIDPHFSSSFWRRVMENAPVAVPVNG